MPPPSQNVAITHRYFWPQNYPYADMLREITEALVDRGHHPTVLSALPPDDHERRQRIDWAREHGMDTHSVDLGDVRNAHPLRKITSHVRYAAWIFRQLLSTRPDTTWVASTPPVIAGLAVRWASRLTGGRYIYHLQDVHPEALMAKRSEHSPGPLMRLARAVDRRTVESAQVSIVLSEDMRQTVLDRGIDPATTDIRVINNFVRLPDAPEPLTPLTSEGPFRMLFAGGIGPFQQLNLVMEVARNLQPHDDLVFDIMGDGPSRAQLEADFGGLPHVNFLGQRPRRDAHAAMCRASCGIVSLLPQVTRVAYPSKVIAYRAYGLPMFALVDPSSDLARELRSSGVAYVPDTDDPALIAAGLRTFRDDLLTTPPDRDAMAADARRQVSAEWVAHRLAGLVDQAIASRP